MQWRIDEAIQENALALEFNPNYVEATAYKGLLLTLNGQADLTIAHERKALDLSPLDPARYLPIYYACNAYTLLGRFEEAVPWCERSVSIHPFWANCAVSVAAYTALGNVEKAATMKAKLHQVKPDYSIGWAKNNGYSKNPVLLQQREDNLYKYQRKAGIAE